MTLADAAREPFIVYSRKDYPDYHELLASVFSATKGRLHPLYNKRQVWFRNDDTGGRRIGRCELCNDFKSQKSQHVEPTFSVG
ncbi:MAG TPA: hypothetical protein VK639_22055, partial [Terriglobales bacterium]|nr:hypothetical protein [Terriglobales bacterium]